MTITIQSDKPIGLACDHAGYTIKKYITDLFDEEGIKYTDFGTNSTDSVDYPDFAHKLGSAIDAGECELGIAICGTGNGINMALNKHQVVRSALCWNIEVTRLVRTHNDANVLTLPGRFITQKETFDMIEIFFNTPFEGGRHQRRIDKIPCI